MFKAEINSYVPSQMSHVWLVYTQGLLSYFTVPELVLERSTGILNHLLYSRYFRTRCGAKYLDVKERQQ
jgi:hypothetical protein